MLKLMLQKVPRLGKQTALLWTFLGGTGQWWTLNLLNYFFWKPFLSDQRETLPLVQEKVCDLCRDLHLHCTHNPSFICMKVCSYFYRNPLPYSFLDMHASRLFGLPFESFSDALPVTFSQINSFFWGSFFFIQFDIYRWWYKLTC